jgi:hypothetical protein
VNAGDGERAARIFEQLAAEEPRYQWFHHAGVCRDNLDQPEAAARCSARRWSARLSAGIPTGAGALRLARVSHAAVSSTPRSMRWQILDEDPSTAGAFALGLALDTKAQSRGLPDRARLDDPLVAEALQCYRHSLALDPETLDALQHWQ